MAMTHELPQGEATEPSAQLRTLARIAGSWFDRRDLSRAQREEAVARLFENYRQLHQLPSPDADPDTVIDLDAVMWAQVKEAIITSPRFAEMFAAGGMFNDGLSNVLAWLQEPVEETAAISEARTGQRRGAR